MPTSPSVVEFVATVVLVYHNSKNYLGKEPPVPFYPMGTGASFPGGKAARA
jgi:hypothetical protein